MLFSCFAFLVSGFCCKCGIWDDTDGSTVKWQQMRILVNVSPLGRRDSEQARAALFIKGASSCRSTASCQRPPSGQGLLRRLHATNASPTKPSSWSVTLLPQLHARWSCSRLCLPLASDLRAARGMSPSATRPPDHAPNGILWYGITTDTGETKELPTKICCEVTTSRQQVLVLTAA